MHNFANKSVQEIVQELMYEEYLERDNVLRNAFISQALKSTKKKKLVFSKNNYNNYLLFQSPSNLSNDYQIKGKATYQPKKKNSAPINIMKAIDIISPKKENKIIKQKKPKELRDISVSDHLNSVAIKQQCIFPQINRKNQSSGWDFGNLEGYKLKSEEMTLEIDEYVRSKCILPSIHQN